MSTGGKVPDAWDDDWVAKADVRIPVYASNHLANHSQQTSAVTPEPAPVSKKLSKAERRAKQAEFNRQLWEDA